MLSQKRLVTLTSNIIFYFFSNFFFWLFVLRASEEVLLSTKEGKLICSISYSWCIMYSLTVCGGLKMTEMALDQKAAILTVWEQLGWSKDVNTQQWLRAAAQGARLLLPDECRSTGKLHVDDVREYINIKQGVSEKGGSTLSKTD